MEFKVQQSLFSGSSIICKTGRYLDVNGPVTPNRPAYDLYPRFCRLRGTPCDLTQLKTLMLQDFIEGGPSL